MTSTANVGSKERYFTLHVPCVRQALCVDNLPVVKAIGDDELTTKSSETGICTTTTYCMVVLPIALTATHAMVYVPSTVNVCVALSTSYEFVPINNNTSLTAENALIRCIC